LNIVKNIKSIAQNVLLIDSRASDNPVNYFDKNVEEYAKEIYSSKGIIVITGIGKSAITANKIGTTITSTVTPYFLMHTGDDIYGDLVMFLRENSVTGRATSGNIPEINTLIPTVKRRCSGLVVRVSNTNSYLARQTTVLNAKNFEDASSRNFSPTSSNRTNLQFGNALTIVCDDVAGKSHYPMQVDKVVIKGIS